MTYIDNIKWNFFILLSFKGGDAPENRWDSRQKWRGGGADSERKRRVRLMARNGNKKSSGPSEKRQRVRWHRKLDHHSPQDQHKEESRRRRRRRRRRGSRRLERVGRSAPFPAARRAVLAEILARSMMATSSRISLTPSRASFHGWIRANQEPFKPTRRRRRRRVGNRPTWPFHYRLDFRSTFQLLPWKNALRVLYDDFPMFNSSLALPPPPRLSRGDEPFQLRHEGPYNFDIVDDFHCWSND